MTDTEWVNAREEENGSWTIIEIATGKALKADLTAPKVQDHMVAINKFSEGQFDKWKKLRETFRPHNLDIPQSG